MKDQLHRFERQRVEIRAHGIIYRGLLVGSDDDYLYLKGETTWITLILESITSVRREGDSEQDWLRKEVKGEPVPAAEAREEKRRYNQSDLEKLYLANLACDWPEPGEPGEQVEMKTPDRLEAGPEDQLRLEAESWPPLARKPEPGEE